MNITYSFEFFMKNNDKFDEWFDAETFAWSYSLFLAKCCSSNFDKWWDSDRYPVPCDYLMRYCAKDVGRAVFS